MCDCDFKSSSEPAGTYSPSKRVRYSMGLVLGQDEFNQEQFYLLERDRALSRLLHGYGAVEGLQVTQDGDVTKVSPGLALVPSGKLVTVPTLQCADLSAWLVKNGQSGNADIGPRVYVVLGYTECATDPQPVPGTACRTDEENLAPSRTTESFTLNFSLTKPEAIEETAIRYVGELVRAIHVLPADVEGANTMADLLAALDAIGASFQPPDVAGGQVQILEPAWLTDGDIFHLYANDLQPVLTALLHHWEAVIRPALPTGVGAGLPNGAPETILLGTLLCSMEGTALSDVGIQIEEAPFLVQTRLLQELLIQLARANDHAALFGLESDDHKQYLLVDSATRALIADLDAATFTVANLRRAVVAGEAVPFEQAIKVDDAAGGDLSQTYPNPQVIGLKSTPLKVARLTEGDLLTYDGEFRAWRNRRPVDPGATGPATGDLTGDYPAPTIQSLQGTGVSVAPEPQEGQLLTWSDGAWRNQDSVVRGFAEGDLTGEYPAPTIISLQGTPLQISEPTNGQVLVWQAEGRRWVNRNLPTPPSGATAHGALTGLANDDHPQYLLATGGRALTGNLNAATHTVGGLRKAQVAGEAVPFEQAVKDRDTAGGDVTSQFANLKVVRLQGVPVSPKPPFSGDILTYDPTDGWHGSQPSGALGPASGDLAGAYPSPSVEALQGTALMIREPQHGDLLVWDAETKAWLNQAPQLSANGPVTWGVVDVNSDSFPTILAGAAGLELRPLARGAFLVLFPGFDPKQPYIVKGTPVLPDPAASMLALFNVVTPKDAPSDGLMVICRDLQGVPRGFHLEISLNR